MSSTTSSPSTTTKPTEPTKSAPPNLPNLQTTITATSDLSTSLLIYPHDQHHHHHEDEHSHHHQQEEAARAHALAWKPALDRRQSWSAQEHKHEQQRKTHMAEGMVQERDGGFSEV